MYSGLTANLTNMRAKYRDASLGHNPYPIAYSPITGEQYCATPGDYFWMADDDYLTDSEGNAMILAVAHNTIEPLTA
jgi:hypothetical protein